MQLGMYSDKKQEEYARRMPYLKPHGEKCLWSCLKLSVPHPYYSLLVLRLWHISVWESMGMKCFKTDLLIDIKCLPSAKVSRFGFLLVAFILTVVTA